MTRLDEIKTRIACSRATYPGQTIPPIDDLERAVEEIEQLRSGYLWLEGLAEGRQITIAIAPADGTLEISEGIYSLYRHVDLADLCTHEAAEVARNE